MTIQQIAYGIRDDLRNNITDPIQRKTQGGGEWIHFDRINDVGKTPEIFIQIPPSPRHDDYTGGGKEHFYQFLVHLVMSEGDRGISPSGDSQVIITNDDELTGAIIDKVINRLEVARLSISGAHTVNMLSYDGDYNLTSTKKVYTIRYEAHKK
jgi:hypothetical protein